MAYKIDLVAAARPNFMKIAPLWHAFAHEPWIQGRIIHTGQHYDREMSGVFFTELGLPAAHVNLGVGGGTHGQQTGRVIERYEACMMDDHPDLVIAVGDVNATAAATLAAIKLNIPVAHLEAGLRSFDRTMPEEINRIVTDSICDYLWAPSLDGVENLLRAGIPPEKIVCVGNIMIDTLEMLMPSIRQCKYPFIFEPDEDGYLVVTFHRPCNVDTRERLRKLCECIAQCAQILPVVFPLHPRTRARLAEFALLRQLEDCPRISVLPPLPYCAFMKLVLDSRAVVTDSGGIQEETSYLGIPCLTLRENTERPTTVTKGTNRLVSVDTAHLVLQSAIMEKKTRPCIELWDGKTAGRVVEQIRKIVSVQRSTGAR